jgi:hypothetical protein
MSDKITTLTEPKGQTRRSNDQEPTSTNARLQWVADLVCAILNAESVVYPLDSQRRATARAKWEGTLRQIALKLRRSGWLKRLNTSNKSERQNTSIAKH